MPAVYIKPTKIPKWADAAESITEPSDGFKNAGWVFNSKPPAAYENWKSKLIGDWFKWVDERIDDGATENEFIIRNPADASAALTISAVSIVVTLPFVGAIADAPGVIAKQFAHEFVTPPSAVGIAGVGDTGVYGEGTLFGGRFVGLRDGGNDRPGVYGVGSESAIGVADGGIGVKGGGGSGTGASGGSGGDFSGGEGVTTGGSGAVGTGGQGAGTGGYGGWFEGGPGDTNGAGGVGIWGHGGEGAGAGAGGIGGKFQGGTAGFGGRDGYALHLTPGGHGTTAHIHLTPMNKATISGMVMGDIVMHTDGILYVYTGATWAPCYTLA